MKTATCLFFIFFCWLQTFTQSLPNGFQKQDLQIHLSRNSGITFDKNGVGYIWRLEGQVHILDTTGQLLPQPLIDISEEVARWHDHGMTGFALHPEFPETPYIYLLYTLDRHHYFHFGTPEYDPEIQIKKQATIGRISRYTVDATSNHTTIIPESRRVLVGTTFDDGFPILFDSHGLGSLVFGEDGSLLATCGDAASSISIDTGNDGNTYFQQALADGIIRPEENVGAFKSQMINNLAGKIIRINPETGEGLSSNPFFDVTNPRSPQSRVWVLGLRNPFRFTIKPGSGSHFPEAGNPGVIYLGDVGFNSWEEIDIIPKGGLNLGWPLYEGFVKSADYAPIMTAYQDAPNPLFNEGNCEQPFFDFQHLVAEDNEAKVIDLVNPCDENKVITEVPTFLHHRPTMVYRNETKDSLPISFAPIFDEEGRAQTITLEHANSPIRSTNFDGICSIAGAFYEGDNFPEPYRNAYFHMDLGGWIRAFYFETPDNLIQVDTFFSGGEKITGLAINPQNGCLYYMSFDNGLQRICFGGNLSPTAQIEVDKVFGVSPLAIQFDASKSFDIHQPLSYHWFFGDGTTSTDLAPIHTFNAANEAPTFFDVILTVTDSLGASAKAHQVISLNNTPPEVKIIDLAEGDHYPVDAPHLIPLRAIVQDKEHTPSELSYEWETFLHHNTHFHAIQAFEADEAYLISSPTGCDGTDYWYRIVLKVTDAANLIGKDEINIFPNCDDDVAIFTQLTSIATNVQIDLNWQTTVEQNIERFLVERSGDGFNFETIGTLQPLGINKEYSFMDQQPLKGVNQYRIKALSTNRTWAYSNISTSFFPPEQNVHLYPNPSDGLFQLDILKTFSTEIQLKLFNANGREISISNWETTLETHFSEMIDLSDLPNGTYYYILKNGREEIHERLVIVK